jgi:hypothetical protein
MPFLRRKIALLVIGAACVASSCGGSSPVAETPSATVAPLAAQIARGGETLLAGVSAPGDKKAIMKQVSVELGVECDYCHDVTDFAAPSVAKQIANYMFAHYASGLVRQGGAAISCGDCHHGQAKPLGDRKERQRIKQLMKTEYVDALRIRANGAALECATCHGAQLDQAFLPR